MTNYFEWKAAGFYQVGHSGGSMHQVETILKSFHYGFDMAHLYFRVDLNIDFQNTAMSDLSFKIIFLSPRKCELLLSISPGGEIQDFVLQDTHKKENLTTASAKKIVEIAVPINTFHFPEDYETIEFVVIVLKLKLEIERWPYQSSVLIPRPSEDFGMKTWSV
jgi:hypothetical protein